jgi:hypothetical protein
VSPSCTAAPLIDGAYKADVIQAKKKVTVESPEPDSAAVQRYSILINQIKKRYYLAQVSYEKANPSASYHMHYEFVPIKMFPFFCTDSVREPSNVVYFNRLNYCIGQYKPEKGVEHVQIATEYYYTKGLNDLAEKKTFKLEFFMYDPTTQAWLMDRNPIFVNIVLTDRQNKYYGCQ